jgi:hypothetical protein
VTKMIIDRTTAATEPTNRLYSLSKESTRVPRHWHALVTVGLCSMFVDGDVPITCVIQASAKYKLKLCRLQPLHKQLKYTVLGFAVSHNDSTCVLC